MRTMVPLLVLILLAAGLCGCNTGAAPPPIVIGHVSDKTRLDKAGDQTELGIRLALHDLDNNDALPKAFDGRKIEVRHTDTRGVPEAFESQAARLDGINRCLALIGGLSVPETIALAHAKVPILTLHGQPAPGAGNHVFYLGMSPARQGQVLARVVAENPQSTRITVLQDERRPESAALADALQKALAEARHANKLPAASVTVLRFGKEGKWDNLAERIKAPGPVVVVDPGKQARWDEIIERLHAQKPDAIVFAGSALDLNAWQRADRESPIPLTAQLVFAGEGSDQRLFDFQEVDKRPILMASAFYADPASERTKAFLKAYRDAFQIDADVHAALAYDGFRMLVEAMKQTAAQLTPDKVREKLQETKDFAGLTGPLTMGTDRVVRRPLFVLRWQNGATALVRRFEAEKQKHE